jgi:GT2 family glycosyltransferase
MRASIHAVVVNYLNRTELRECVQSLIDEPLITSITLIDNSHLVEEMQLSLSDFSLVKILRPGSNLGYAGGNNLGIRAAISQKDDLVLVINPDATLLSKTINDLLRELEEHGLDLVSPSLLEPDKLEAISDPAWDMCLGRGILEANPKSKITPSRYKPIFFGACFLAKVELFLDIGLLNEELFLYGEELDLVFRMEEHGKKWGISAKSAVTHLRGVSTGSGSKKQKSDITEFHSARSMMINGLNYEPNKVLIWAILRFTYAIISPKLSLQGRFAVIKGLLSGFVPK